jgi:enamine deaminase RidA (YjgF/YER057c/UK114 family)
MTGITHKGTLMNRRLFFETLGVASVALGLSKAAKAQAGNDAEARLKELGLTLPDPAGPVAAYVPFRISGNQVFIAGNIPPLDLDIPTAGKVGSDLTPEQGYTAARLAALRVIAQLKVACDGDLGRVVKALQIRGFVSCTPDFTGQSGVVNGASDLFREVFGEAGLGARAALGTNSLPLNASVEIESIWEIRI